MIRQMMQTLSRERPVGTNTNTIVNDYLEQQFLEMGFKVDSLPFECTVWETDKSYLMLGEKIFEVAASPFSEAFDGKGELITVQSTDDLQNADCTEGILLLSGDLTQTSLQPKNYPFYFPDEHKNLIDLLERKKPKAIIAATGRHPMCGLDPFPLFEDGKFLIPSAYISSQRLNEIQTIAARNKTVTLSIQSTKKLAKSRQLVATKGKEYTKGKIVLCAHIDTKYGTDGALDNAIGVGVLLKAAKRLNANSYGIDIVPFNGEEYYEASGEIQYIRYLEERKDSIFLLINLDSPCHVGAKNAISFYNFLQQDKEIATRLMTLYPDILAGPEWYAGDHCPFAFKGIPSMAVTSSDIFEGALEYTHTPKDTLDTVNLELVEQTADYLVSLVNTFQKR